MLWTSSDSPKAWPRQRQNVAYIMSHMYLFERHRNHDRRMSVDEILRLFKITGRTLLLLFHRCSVFRCRVDSREPRVPRLNARFVWWHFYEQHVTVFTYPTSSHLHAEQVLYHLNFRTHSSSVHLDLVDSILAYYCFHPYT